MNHATNALSRCAISSTATEDIDVAPLALYRHIVEATDGIEVLISSCCPVPAIPLLRSSFEALLSIQYLFENRSDYEKRSLAWFVCYIHQRLATYEMLDPATQRGKQVKATHKDDAFLPDLTVIPISDVQKAANNLRSLLIKPHLAPIEAEYLRAKSHQWHHFFGGPVNLEQLARHLKSMGLYDFLYRPWSRFAHAQDLVQLLKDSKPGRPSLGRLRDQSRLRQVASLAASFQLGATREMLKWFRPAEDLKTWFIEEVQDRYDRLKTRPP